MKVECPGCATAFELDRLGVPMEPGTEATIVCPVCDAHFDVHVHEPQKTWQIFGFTIPLGRKQVRARGRQII
jgi:hypothetical protein